MLNLIRMEFYRLSKHKTTWAIFIIILILTFFFMALLRESYESMEENPKRIILSRELDDALKDSYEQINIEKGLQPGDFQMSVGCDSSWFEDGYKITVWDAFMALLKSKLYLLLISLSIIIYARTENKHGYIKVIGGLMPSKSAFALSKVIPAMCYMLLTLISVFLSIIVYSKIFFGYVSFSNISTSIVPLLVMILLHLAFVTITLAITLITQSTSFSIVWLTFTSIGLCSIMYYIINYLLVKKEIISNKFVFDRYLVSGSIGFVRFDSPTKDLISTTVLSLVYIVVSISLAMLVYKKRDIT